MSSGQSDGTAAGTLLVKDILPGAIGSYPSELTNVNGKLFFQACSTIGWGLADCELWKSDGTEAGTILVKDIAPDPTRSSSPENLTSAGGRVFFTASDDAGGEELWQSDGTEAGTMLAAELVPGSGGSLPRELAVVGAFLFFSAVGEDIGRELWLLPIPEPDSLLLGLATVGALAVVARRRGVGTDSLRQGVLPVAGHGRDLRRHPVGVHWVPRRGAAPWHSSRRWSAGGRSLPPRARVLGSRTSRSC